ncbi:MAG TPA: transcriptional regulator, partial [Pyrinomonadaceae bacterium]
METETRQLYQFDDFCVDATERRLLRRGQFVPLTPKAFETLLYLVCRSGRVVEKDELLRAIWPDTFVEEATLAQNIFTLRRALGQGRETLQYIETIPKRGYRFTSGVTSLSDEGATLVVEQHTRTRVITEEEESEERSNGNGYPPGFDAPANGNNWQPGHAGELIHAPAAADTSVLWRQLKRHQT